MLENRGLEIVIIAVVVLLLFGAKRLPDSARALGKSLRILKSEVGAMKSPDVTVEAGPAPAEPTPRTLQVEASPAPTPTAPPAESPTAAPAAADDLPKAQRTWPS
ncbi:Sec-independent protein translocase subunit TatA [Streptacidiphilus anmyonensis]|uniref:Sec-independent protein translocase subunit TatA n=1 Tax=Streptacidiphilus anmyonensis TaxID=405782 RepID=UPI0007C84353|nr:Sec-independent protein translocase subunit TatA [Streptacidiphilus anmyonensis]